MIRYSLKCTDDHRFESWFRNSEAFEKLCHSGMITCPVCGETSIEKAVMAPRVAHCETSETSLSPDTHTMAAATSGPVAEAIARLREALEAHSENVGTDFAREARAIHEGEAPARAIHGEASTAEARELVEDGVPVMPIPFLTGRKVN